MIVRPHFVTLLSLGTGEAQSQRRTPDHGSQAQEPTSLSRQVSSFLRIPGEVKESLFRPALLASTYVSAFAGHFVVFLQFIL